MTPLQRLLALCCATLSLQALAQHSPYAGQESRRLKALSDEEVAAYVEGRGQGFARPAELNGYPGPMHVLELADRLALSEAQKRDTQALMDRHKAEVRALGMEYVAAEEALEALLASRKASPAAISEASARAATLHGRIRAAHLVTHLEQARLLTAAQTARYIELRGYAGGGSHKGHHR